MKTKKQQQLIRQITNYGLIALVPVVLICAIISVPSAAGIASAGKTKSIDVEQDPGSVQTSGFGGRANGVENLEGPADGVDGISPDMLIEIQRKISKYKSVLSQQTLPSDEVLSQPTSYDFFPHAGILGKDIYISNFVDVTRGQGVPTAWDCSRRTYSGHTGHDSLIRSFREQAIGQPVFAALDGRVIGWRDDAPDMNLQCITGAPVNYILLDHGDQQYSFYLHFRQFSIPPELKIIGQFIKAGTQVGLTGSSGCSTWPHLHFESWSGGFGVTGLPGPNFQINWPFIYEPFSGLCNQRLSGWTQPQPFVGLQTYVKDIALSASPFPNGPGNSFTDPLDLNPRVAMFTTDQTVHYRPELINLPAGSSYDVIFIRPDGSVHFRDTRAFTNSTFIGSPVGPWWFAHTLFMTGSWRIDLWINGLRMPSTFFQVVSSPAQIVNRAPRTPTIAIGPTQRRSDDVLWCSVTSSITDRDPDTDVVSYRYEWRINGVTERIVSTSAALADALPAGEAKPGDSVTCSVTPSDGRLFGATTSQTIQIAPFPTIQFSQVAYSVGEAGTSANLTLTRSGDTSGVSTVAYTSRDSDNFTVNCSHISGNAFARCDFATSIDTLTFATGETSKTVAIPIINDSLAEGNETFQIMLVNASGATLGSSPSATITIIDNDSVNGPNPIFSTSFFVRQHYLDFLSREPEVGEPWTAKLNNCSNLDNNPTCDRLTVSGAFFGSPEFQLKGYFVYRFYKLALNRLPLYTEIVVDMRAVTGASATEVFQKKATFTNNFVLLQEFANLYNARTNTQYVNTLMGRYGLTQITTPDPAAPDGTNKVTLTTTDLINRLNGVGGTFTRAQVLRAIADSDQVFQLEFNPAFVAMQYYGYLRRTPDMPGFNAWLTFLNANPGASRTMVNGFMNSDEYRRRFGPV